MSMLEEFIIQAKPGDGYVLAWDSKRPPSGFRTTIAELNVFDAGKDEDVVLVPLSTDLIVGVQPTWEPIDVSVFPPPAREGTHEVTFFGTIKLRLDERLRRLLDERDHFVVFTLAFVDPEGNATDEYEIVWNRDVRLDPIGTPLRELD